MRPDVGRIVALGALGGILAGMMLALTEMIYGWASSTHTAWDAPTIYAAVRRVRLRPLARVSRLREEAPRPAA